MFAIVWVRWSQFSPFRVKEDLKFGFGGLVSAKNQTKAGKPQDKFELWKLQEILKANINFELRQSAKDLPAINNMASSN